jgi:hypothetical protein
MVINPMVHKLFHAYIGAHMVVLISNILRYESISNNVLEETAVSIFRASYLKDKEYGGDVA